MDKETKELIVDYFEPSELVEYLEIDMEYLVELLDEEIIEKLDALLELMGVDTE